MCQMLGIPRRARMDISFLLASKSGKKQGGWGGEETDFKQKKIHKYMWNSNCDKCSEGVVPGASL